MELCLGTVQFGMDYGIRGKKKPPLSDCLEMLDYAVHNGINTIDTASAYGDAENVVGTYFRKDTAVRRKIRLISKFHPNLLDNVLEKQYYPIMRANLNESLRRLHTDYLDGYLIHSARYVYNDAIIEALVQLKQEGYVKSIGVSVYEIEEAKTGILRDCLDFLQLPFSVLDQRMLHKGIFALAEERGFPLHSRSAFIQGLVLMVPEEIPFSLRNRVAPFLKRIDLICKETGLTRIQIAIGFVKRQAAITHLVFGVRNLKQLKEDISIFQQDLPDDVAGELETQFSSIAADIVMPSLWKK